MKKQQLKEKYKDEEVFVVVSNVLENIKDRFSKEKHDVSIWSKYDTIGTYIKRYEAEGNPAFKQLIPYVVIFNETRNKVYIAKRIGGEPRLTNQYSLGFGGHVNKEDGYIQPLFKCAFRELHEEINATFTTKLEYVGTVRDLTSKLNDHMGLVFFINAISSSVSIKETDSLVGEWMDMQALKDNYGKFEGWAKYIIDYIYENNLL